MTPQMSTFCWCDAIYKGKHNFPELFNAEYTLYCKIVIKRVSFEAIVPFITRSTAYMSCAGNSTLELIDLNIFISETRLYILLELAHFTTNKMQWMQLKWHLLSLRYVVFKRIWILAFTYQVWWQCILEVARSRLCWQNAKLVAKQSSLRRTSFITG